MWLWQAGSYILKLLVGGVVVGSRMQPLRSFIDSTASSRPGTGVLEHLPAFPAAVEVHCLA